MEMYQKYLIGEILQGAFIILGMSMSFAVISYLKFKDDKKNGQKINKWLLGLLVLVILLPDVFLVEVIPYVQDLEQNSFVIYEGAYVFEDGGARGPDYCHLIDSDGITIYVDYRSRHYSFDELQSGAIGLVYAKHSRRLVDVID